MPSFSCSKESVFKNAGPDVSHVATTSPSLCPFVSQGSFPVPAVRANLALTVSHGLALLWMMLPGVISELITSGMSFTFLHKTQCLSCGILPAGSGLSGHFRGKCTQAYLSFCLSVNTHGVRRTHTHACEQIAAHVSDSLLQFLWHFCEELLCLAVLKGLSISPVKFWKFRGL